MGDVTMSYRQYAAAALLSFAALASANTARAADVDYKPVVKAPKVKPAAEVPFFFINDNRLTYAYTGQGVYPGASNKIARQTFAFTHFDAWAYGTNFINVILDKSNIADPASPCPFNAPAPGVGRTGCAGAAEFYGMVRSTFGWNEIFDTKTFSYGMLRNISFEVGAEGETKNSFVAPNKRAVVGGLQFAFDLPYKGFFNVAPLIYKEWNHNATLTPGFVAPTGFPGLFSGAIDYRPTWAVETNYYMDLGFLPESMQYFSISGRAGWYGPKGTGTGGQVSSVAVPGSVAFAVPTKVELNSEPIRLTFDASKAAWGQKYSHFVDVWIAYRYWQNKFGLDHNAAAPCTLIATGSCTESALYSGVTVKF